MKFEHKIGIVTVLYNSQTVIEAFFKTLAKQTYDNLKLYVIDNNSPDNSLFECHKWESVLPFEIEYIINKENYGVAKGNNLGIQAALRDGCDFILLSNNDIEVNPDTIEILYKGMFEEKFDLVVPKIYIYGSNKFWAAGGHFDCKRALTPHYGYNQEDVHQYDFNRALDYAATCFMLIPKRVFDVVGMMDEKYFVYYDDSDFIYRTVFLNHFKLGYIYSSVVFHKESVSVGKKSDFYYRYIYRNRIYFVKKHFKHPKLFFLREIFATYTVRLLRMLKNIHQWKIIRSAILEGIKL